MSGTQINCVANPLELAGNLLKMTHVLEGLKPAEDPSRPMLGGQAAINKSQRLTVRLGRFLGIPRTCVSETVAEGVGMKNLAAKFFQNQIQFLLLKLRTVRSIPLKQGHNWR